MESTSLTWIFVQQNWPWILLAVSAIVMLVLPSPGAKMLKTVTEATLAMNREKALVLDVRAKEHYSQGHIAGSKNIPHNELDARTKEWEAWKKRLVIVVDTKQINALRVAKKLAQAGIESYVLKGGLDEWTKQNLPLVTKT